MSYVEEITEPLIKTLSHTAGLRKGQIAGHVANLEFWMGEVAHACKVIDGYEDRFRTMKEATPDMIHYLDHFPPKPVRPGLSHHDRVELRRRLIDAVYLFLGRCYAEEFIPEATLDAYADQLDLDKRELKRKKK